MKKKSPSHATFGYRLSILLCLAHMVGCSASRAVPEMDARKAEALVDVGTRFLRERRLSEAKKAYELAFEVAPVAAAVDGLGCVALLEGLYEVAEGYFMEAYEMDRSYDEALVNLGLVKELQGDPTEAKAIYLRYLKNHPSSGRVRNNLAALEYDRGRRTIDTVASLEKAIVLSNQGVSRDNLQVLRGK